MDIVDKICSSYDASRNCRRWPLIVFFDIMNISAINGYVVHTINKNYVPNRGAPTGVLIILEYTIDTRETGL